MNKKVLVPLLAVLIVGASAAYVFARPADHTRHKIDGTVYVLPKEFLVNLADGRYAKLSVALVLAEGQATGGGGHEAATPPEGFGTLAQEAVVRDIVTDVVTDQNGDTLISAAGRRRIKQEILRQLRKQTDVRVNDVLLPDVAVQ